MKVKCPDCKQKFEIDENEYDEGDFLNCPECNLEMTVVLDKGGKIKVKTAKEKDLDSEETGEFGEVFEEE